VVGHNLTENNRKHSTEIGGNMQLSEILENIEPVDEAWIEKARARTAQLVMSTRALGCLHNIAEQLCGIQKSLFPSVDNKAI